MNTNAPEDPPQDENEKAREPEDEQDDDRPRREGWVPDFLKRSFYAGMGALFTSEEGVRRLANEFSLPKDLAASLIQQAQGTKDELFRVVAAELRGFLESLDIGGELARMLTSLSFEIRTEVRFIPNDKQAKRKAKGEKGEKDDGTGEGKAESSGFPRPSITQRFAIRRRKRTQEAEAAKAEGGGEDEDGQA